ncbi:MAG: hypothetical protein LBL94_08015 [Prevotellaceae bacterium]|jgi:hypothetical protein|nr:hypothetical protein [Prevotellaceae bacterium]
MKKFFYFVLAAYATCLGIIGCSKNTSAPIISFGGNAADATEALVDVGGSKEVLVTIKADAKLKEVRYFKKRVNGEEVPSKSITKFSNPKKFESTITLRDITSDVVLVVEAVDRKNRTTTAEFSVKTGYQSAAQTNIRLGFNMLNTLGSSYSVSQGKALLLAEAKQAQQDVDFMFFYGKKNGVTVTAPSSSLVTRVFNNSSYGVQTWSNRNETRLVKVNLDYEAASAEDIANALSGATTSVVNHMSNGDTVAFQTASGKIGLIKVFNIGPNSASSLNINVRTI